MNTKISVLILEQQFGLNLDMIEVFCLNLLVFNNWSKVYWYVAEILGWDLANLWKYLVWKKKGI
jgi:hypothetical protein